VVYKYNSNVQRIDRINKMSKIAQNEYKILFQRFNLVNNKKYNVSSNKNKFYDF
jgi:hypothetical protein